MSRQLVLSGVLLWVGLTLILSKIRWFARVPLAQRLRPYATTAVVTSTTHNETWQGLLTRFAQTVGGQLTTWMGVSDSAQQRLDRIHAANDAGAFRLHQLGNATGALAVAAIASALFHLPVAAALLTLVGLPMLTYLIIEQRLSTASATWQLHIYLELPVISEQLAMLLSAGYSLGAALQRLADRGHGVCSQDLELVMRRVQQGLTEAQALQEWAATVNVPALDRLVAVLALNRHTTDLGRLVSEEARSIRRDVQREFIETMERREQQVWIPVTVATLIPGTIFLAIPFIEALRLFSGS